MTLREIFEILCEDYGGYEVAALEELESRVEFIEKLIEDGLDLDDEYCIQFIWQGGPDDKERNISNS